MLQTFQHATDSVLLAEAERAFSRIGLDAHQAFDRLLEMAATRGAVEWLEVPNRETREAFTEIDTRAASLRRHDDFDRFAVSLLSDEAS
jgi:antitoxin component of RelBE/YafQ-DinJ toxin-antitoxin module